MRALSLSLLAVVAFSACRCGFDPLETPRATLIADPEEVNITAPVAQDTRIVIQVSNPRFVKLSELRATLEDPSTRFRIEEPIVDEVLQGQVEEIVVIVRPVVVGQLSATLILDADDDARPNHAEVVINVTAIDAGLPDICANSPETSEFQPIIFPSIGVNSVARSSVQVCNCGTRDLLLDSVAVEPEVDGDDSIVIATPVAAGQPLGPSECMSVDLVFAPRDLEEHLADLVLLSNDPDEPEVRIPAEGRASACPVACIELLDPDEQFEPFDTVRLSAHCSQRSSDLPDAPVIEFADWQLEVRPVGSTAVIEISDDLLIAEVPVDLAGRYTVRAHVFDAEEVRSCEAAVVTWDVIPTEDLHIQLVWDHPSADLDLHTTRGPTFAVFDHSSDVYFSNRDPEPIAPWSENPDENPSLDKDDDLGYGPENTNIVHPAASSQWRIYVHYWNAQTDADARTTATLRVFVYGQQVIEVQRTFEEDEQLWHALDLTWPEVQGDPASISQIGVVEPFARPF
jgi:hypothetical protein